MKNKKVIALIAHDNKKPDIVNWAIKNKEKLSAFELCGTGHTAKLISEATDLKVKAYMSGPMGGDQQIGAKIAEKKYLCRCTTMKQKEYFNCSSYRKKKKATCTSHQITVEAVEHFVLTNLQRVLAFAKDYEQEFLEIVRNENEKELRKKLQSQTRELEEADKRIQVLDRIIQNLYEDKVCGNLTDERFVKMSQAYEQEQRELKERAYHLRQELSKAKEQSDNVTRFMRSVRKYTEITELTPDFTSAES